MAITLVNFGSAVGSGDGDILRVAFTKIDASLTDLDTRLASTTALVGALGNSATRNVGTTAGTVADGGALTAETARAQAAEQANTTLINNEVSRAQAAELLKAPIASPTFTGVPAAPTATVGTSTTQLATTAFVAAAVAAGSGGSGGVPTSRQILGGGLATGGGDLTADRTITVPKAAQSDVAAGTDDAKALTSYSIAAALGAKAPLASPTFVGTPNAPTAAAGTNNTQIATASFLTGSSIRADLAQTFTSAQRIQAKQNAGVLGAGVPQLTANTALAATDLNKVYTGYSPSNSLLTHTLPAVSTAIAGDRVEFIAPGVGSGQIAVRPSGSDSLYANGTGYGNASPLPIQAGSAVTFICDGYNWYSEGNHAPYRSALNADVAQSFTAAQQAQLLANLGIGGAVPVRQTVLSGPASSSAPSFLPATASGLSMTTQNVSAASPLVATAAGGFGASGAIDVVGMATSNFVIGTFANITNYLFFDISGGALSAGATSLPPIYQPSGPASTANGQYTFVTGEMQGYLGNGTIANKIGTRVFFGEAVTNSSTITSTIAYAYQGQYDSGWTAGLPTAVGSKAHNLGVPPLAKRFIAECTTADNGYAVGDQLSSDAGIYNPFSGFAAPMAVSVTRSLAAWTVGGVGGFGAVSKGGGNTGGLTTANWRWKIVTQRGW